MLTDIRCSFEYEVFLLLSRKKYSHLGMGYVSRCVQRETGRMEVITGFETAAVKHES